MVPSLRAVISFVVPALFFIAGGSLHSVFNWLGLIYLGGLSTALCLEAVTVRRLLRITPYRKLPPRIALAEHTPVTLELHNNSPFAVDVQVAEDLPEHVTSSDDEIHTRMRPGEKQSFTYRLKAVQRGEHQIKGTDVRVRARWGLLFRQYKVDNAEDIHVYPNFVEPQRYELQLRRGIWNEQGLGRIRQLGHGWQFESLRFYVKGDDPSRIDWKASAKRARLVVRNYEAERRQSVVVMIDAGRATAGELEGISRLDYMINAALMFGYVALRQGDWFSLLVFNDRVHTYIPPMRRVENADRIVQALYQIQPTLVESDYGNAFQFLNLRHRKRSLVCLMTDILDKGASDEVVTYLIHGARSHLPLAVALSNPEIHGIAQQPLRETWAPYRKAAAVDLLTAREEALQTMRNRGVEVLDVDPRQMTPRLVNQYLEIKASRRL